jgi:hypothetical protein
MPPSGGIVVFDAGFSTAFVRVFCTSLWTSPGHPFADRHLSRLADILRRRAKFSTAIVEHGR